MSGSKQRTRKAAAILRSKHPDTVLMDWLESRFVHITCSGTKGQPPSSWIVDEWEKEDGVRGGTLRAALNAAIAKWEI